MYTTPYAHPYFSRPSGSTWLSKTTIRKSLPREWVYEHANQEDQSLVDQANIRDGRLIVSRGTANTLAILSCRDILPYLVSEEDKQNTKFLEIAAEYATAEGVVRLYRVTDRLLIDDMGRWYNYNAYEGVFTFRKVKLTRGGEYRNRVKVFGNTDEPIYMPAYQAAGLAGLHPQVQSALMVSNKVDFHHMNENLFDIRPSNIAPLPTWVHRDYHYPRFHWFYDEFFSKKVF